MNGHRSTTPSTRFLPVEEFVVDTFRTEYTVGADTGGVDERAIAVLGSVLERLEAVCVPEAVA